MKKLLTILFSMLTLTTFAQFTTTNPDTVCINTPGSTYQVPSLGAGYIYTWTVTAPGTITSGQGTNQINVNWSAAGPGLINNAVSVFATSPSGCQSLPVTLNVFILQVVPAITALGPFCANDACVNLVGTPAGGIFTGNGVVNNQFCPQTAGPGTHTITYAYVQNGCVFTATTTVVVNPIPVLTPIQHN